ncbi:Isoeugenol synthase 1 [Acorus gramineus]|uniref:Isoeugenol synthase 1 n=1 Tax=Acorus gramineus TaxID=55184 RepID=A0AAV9AZL2_ACOGR|nr:Isoeugenol synthase 1 [Acorus gramineus]
MTGASKILVIGATGYIGKHLVRASVAAGHPTIVLIRAETLASTDPSKQSLFKEFQSIGVKILKGDLNDHDLLVRCIKRVDVVISAVSTAHHLDQHKIVNAIKEAGNVKRFLPSEFGIESGRVRVLPIFQFVMDNKVEIRKAVEEAGIPHTFVAGNFFAEYFIDVLMRPNENKDTVTVYGTGETKGVLILEEDVAAFAIKTVDDPRTLNRLVICKPPKNTVTQLGLIELWEKKTGKKYKRVHLPEEEMVRLSETLPEPDNIRIAIVHNIFVDESSSRELGEDDLEASALYPDYKYSTIDRVMDRMIANPPKIKPALLPSPKQHH